MCPGCGQIITKARCRKCYMWRVGNRTKRKIPPESAIATSEQPPPTAAHNYLQPEAAAKSALSSSSGKASTSRQPQIKIPRQPISGGRTSCEANPLNSHESSIHGDSDSCSQDDSDVDIVETFPAAIASITNKNNPAKLLDMRCYSRAFQHE